MPVHDGKFYREVVPLSKPAKACDYDRILLGVKCWVLKKPFTQGWYQGQRAFMFAIINY